MRANWAAYFKKAAEDQDKLAAGMEAAAERRREEASKRPRPRQRTLEELEEIDEGRR